MPELIVMSRSYSDDMALEAMIRYAGKCRLLGGYAVNPANAPEEMRLVKALWSKEGGRQVRHFILSFAQRERIDPDAAMRLGFEVCKYYGQYQSVYGIHTDTDHLHIHWAVNTVSFLDGRMYTGGFEDWYRLRDYIQSLLPDWYVRLTIKKGVDISPTFGVQ